MHVARFAHMHAHADAPGARAAYVDARRLLRREAGGISARRSFEPETPWASKLVAGPVKNPGVHSFRRSSRPPAVTADRRGISPRYIAVPGGPRGDRIGERIPPCRVLLWLHDRVTNSSASECCPRSSRNWVTDKLGRLISRRETWTIN